MIESIQTHTTHYTDFDDGSAAPTYSITPSFTCQNLSHSHHPSHFPLYHRQLMVDTVVEESTGGSIVTVIDANRGRSAGTVIDVTCLSNGNIPANGNEQQQEEEEDGEEEEEELATVQMDTMAIPSSPISTAAHHATTPTLSDDANGIVENTDMMPSNEAGTELLYKTEIPQSIAVYSQI